MQRRSFNIKSARFSIPRWAGLLIKLRYYTRRQKLVGAGSPIALKDTQRLKNPPPSRARVLWGSNSDRPDF
jgi:hypothetical protein